jgi:hypothetical protein
MWMFISDQFLVNGLLSTFLRNGLRMQRGKRGVTYAARTEGLQRREMQPASQ